MKKIVINGDNRRFNISSIVVGYLEENKEEVLEFEIPEKYAEYGKKACFSANGRTFVKNFDNIVSNKLTITRDISQFKELDMTIAFFKTENEDKIVARTSILHILIENAIVCDDDVKPDEPKIIVLDNLIQNVQELNNEISLNENERLENENTRQTNEEERVNNENSREEYITNLKGKVDDGEFNGKSLEFVWQGTKLGIRLQGQQEYQFVDLVGAVGPAGPQGNPFQVKKTYATIDEMINDYDNMQINDYVMISGNIEEEDNAKLFVKTENETPVYRWQYLADFSGASGIQGPVGKTPNLKIGTVSTLNPNENATVEITGTDENPILNFGIPKAEQVQSDWSQTDSTKPDYIKNRIGGYVEYEKTEYLPVEERTFELENLPYVGDKEYKMTIIYDAIGLNKIEVIYDGEIYIMDYSLEDPDEFGISIPYWGNKSIVDSTAEDTGEPFFIKLDCGRFCIRPDEADIHTLGINILNEKIVKIPEQYLPDTLASKEYVNGLIGNINTELASLTTVSEVSE